MKYAIIKTGSNQIKVEVGKPIWIEKINVEVGQNYPLKHVLALSDAKKLHTGTPLLNAEVQTIVQKHGKGPKIIIFKTRAKSNWKRKQGHRQQYTRLLITEIILNGKVIDKISEKKELIDEKINNKNIDNKSINLEENVKETTTKVKTLKTNVSKVETTSKKDSTSKKDNTSKNVTSKEVDSKEANVSSKKVEEKNNK